MAVTQADGQWHLTADDAPIATLTSSADPLNEAPRAVPEDVARATTEAFLDVSHPFPTCYVCGPQHPRGMRLFSGPTGGTNAEVACVWNVPGDLQVATAHHSQPALWAALDCPSGWAAGLTERPMVLGTITAKFPGQVNPGEPAVIVARRMSAGARTAKAASALWQGKTLIGHAEATWVEVDPRVFNALRA